jgi:hypothetical protein
MVAGVIGHDYNSYLPSSECECKNALVMSHRLRHSAVAFFLILLVASPSYADHRDGSYCTTTGYVAFDLSSFMTPDLPASHILKIVRFDLERGIYGGGELQLEDFDVQMLKCNTDGIELAGSGPKFVYVRYAIDFSDPQNGPKVTEHIHDPNRRFDILREGPSPGGYLGIPSKRLITLAPSSAEQRFELRFSGHPVSGYGAVTYTKAELVQADSRDHVLQGLVLYEFAEEHSGD